MKISSLVKTIISILLLLIFYPAGLIVMWIVAPWSRGLKIFLTILFFFPFIFLLMMLPISFFRAQKQIYQPLQNNKIYQDKIYSISFDYPANWSIFTNNVAPKILETEKERFLSTPIKTILLTDIPYDPKGKMPSCMFSVNIYRNPQNLLLKEWYGKFVDEGRNAPKDENEKAARDLLLQTKNTAIGDIQVLQTFVGGDYIFANEKAVFKIKQISEFECSSGYKIPFNSLKIK